MHPDRLSTRPQSAVNHWAWPSLQRLVWLLAALLIAGLMAGVSVASIAATDPNWNGTTPENISHSDQHNAWQPDVESDSSGQMIVVWSDQRSGDRNIYAINGNGGTWSAPQVVSETTEESRYPDVLVVGDETLVTWVDGKPPTVIYEAKKTEAGAWEARQIPSPVPLVDTQARLAAGAGRLHAVFNARGTVSDIYYASRLLTETAWLTATRIYTSTAWAGSWFPALAIGPDEETLHVVWQDHYSSKRMIMYMSGTVSGDSVNWSPPLTLSTGITWSVYPAIAADSRGNLHVVWGEQGAGGYDEQYVRYRRYDIVSGTWTTPAVRIDPNPVQANKDNPTYIAPSLALWEQDNQVRVCVAWYGFRAGDPAAEDVLLRCSQDGGNIWSSTKTENVSHSSAEGWGISFKQSTTFDTSGRLHVVWQERTGEAVKEDYNVYYSRGMNQVFLPLVIKE
ncbi:MAG: hypothetical protein ACE5OS_11955 [Anaerolineae bacterium]